MAVLSNERIADIEAGAAVGELSGDDFMALVQSKNVDARVAAAGRADAPLGALLAFAQDRKVEVRVAVASNERIGRATTVCLHLADDKADEVAFALIGNPAASQAAMEILAQTGPRAARASAQARIDRGKTSA